MPHLFLFGGFMFKARQNFSCNSVRKLSGELLSENDSKIIGELINSLIENDIIEEIAVDPKPIKKKRSRKKVS